MKTIRVLVAALSLIGIAAGWYFERIPTWITIGTIAALFVWGFNLDWRRKERRAVARRLSKEDERRHAEDENRS